MKVIFTGDTSITGSFIEKINKQEELFSIEIYKVLQSSDYVIANLEGPTTEALPTLTKSIQLKSPIQTIEYLSKRNINVFNLSNNHILDYKTNGLRDTITSIDKNKGHYFGASIHSKKEIIPLILEKDNISIALFGLTDTPKNDPNEKGYVVSSNDISIIKKKIYEIKHKVDYIILNFHGGEEFTNYPSPTKRNLMKKYAKIDGVDIVIGHHSHTLQSYEKVGSKYVFYSLGNFIFDIPEHDIYNFTKIGALLAFSFTKEKVSFKWVPFKIKKGEITQWEQNVFLPHLTKISDFNNYISNWRKEAYRVLFRKGNPLITPEKEGEASLQNKSFLGLLFSKKFYTKAIQILLSNNYRSLYISAVIHKLFFKKENATTVSSSLSDK